MEIAGFTYDLCCIAVDYYYVEKNMDLFIEKREKSTG